MGQGGEGEPNGGTGAGAAGRGELDRLYALAYDELVSNRGGPRRHLRHEPPIARERGDELGIFQLGSTVVLLIEDEGFRFLPGIESGAWYPMGSALGRFGS